MHIKHFSLVKDKIKLSATVEHPKIVISVEIDGNKVSVIEKPRTRR